MLNQISHHAFFTRQRLLQNIFLFLVVILFIANLNALIDTILHPEIPYFDEEHFIVGGLSAFAVGIFFGIVILYARRLERAITQIKKLEGLLPICSNCKKIRTDDNKWHQIEEYIMSKTDATFTHGYCPECAKALFGLDIPTY